MIQYENDMNPALCNVKPSGIRKFFSIAEEMDNVISLGVGEPDFLTPWHIRREGIDSLDRGATRYTANAGLLSLLCPPVSFALQVCKSGAGDSWWLRRH